MSKANSEDLLPLEERRIVKEVKQPLSNQEKLRITFRKTLRKGYVNNAELDPMLPPSFRLTGEPDETFIVRVDSTKGGHYWFSDRRLVHETAGAERELLPYDAIQNAHWMFSDLTQRLKSARSEDEISTIKTDHGDRLEIELPTGNIALEGLGQAYAPTLSFFQWVTKSKEKPI